MKRICLSHSLVCHSLSLALVMICNSADAQSKTIPSAQRSDFVSDASFIVGTYAPENRDHTPAAMAAAANAFLDSLNDVQRKSAGHDLNSPERRLWTNLPARPDAGGVHIENLTQEQVKLACNLMANLFSEQGYDKMRDIMLADDQLLEGGRPRGGFGTENFAIVLFGTPSVTEPWAFQIDGHHVGVNLAFHGPSLTMSPSFIGTQPHAFKIAGTEFQPFKHETELAHQLVMSFSDEQIKQAILRPKRANILTGPGNDGLVPKATGIDCSSFTDDQKKTLLSLLRQWVDDIPEPHSSIRMKQLESEFDQMKLAWSGSQEPGSDVSYIIQSPSLILEFACQDLGGNPLDHLHSNYRDPTNEYGKQLK